MVTDVADAAVATRFDGSTADCVTVNVWPPAVIAPDRPTVSAFAATSNAIDPLPLPDEVVVSHTESLSADQVHGAGDVMLTVPESPPAGAEMPDEDSEYVHTTTVCTTPVDGGLPLKLLSPVYVAVRVRLPGVVSASVHEPAPDASSGPLHDCAPSVTLTVPLGVPAPGETADVEKFTTKP